MVNAAIELHDSVINSISQVGTIVGIDFSSVYIHKSAGRPGIDAGSGWTQKAILKIIGANVAQTTTDYPYYLSDGKLDTGEEVFDNLLPLPLNISGQIQLELSSQSGAEIIINGSSIELSLVGEPVFVENFPGISETGLAEIDWKKLAKQLGTLRKDGERGSSVSARQAIEILLGEANLRQAVDYYIAGKPGSELARTVLWQIHPWSAMKYCYDIYKSEAAIEIKRSAVELLRVVADKRALNWVDEFISDPDIDIQCWGIGLLDQLLWSQLVWPEEAEELLLKAEKHTNEQVQETTAFIRQYLKRREES